MKQLVLINMYLCANNNYRTMKYYITFYQDYNGLINQLRCFRIERPKDAKEAIKRFAKHGRIRAAWISKRINNGPKINIERIQ